MVKLNLAGQRFGKLTVIRFTHQDITGRSWFLCHCDCGIDKALRSSCLLGGKTNSCGCGRRTHCRSYINGKGGKMTAEYRTWCDMKQRCFNPNHKSYKHYGGRGITVCDRWLKFENFLADMGERPTGLSIDRIDNDGSYEPGNCRWATQSEQMNNTRPRSVSKKVKRERNMSDRQLWLLIYMLSRHPIGIADTSRVPYSCDYNGKNYGCPGGIRLVNLLGLKRRGLVHEPQPGIFYLTENGVLEAQHAADDPQWV